MLQLKDVTKRFGDLEAVTHLSIWVQSGEIYGLLGPNGAGKSTTVNMICGLLPPTAGEITVGGYSLSKHSRDAKQAIGVVPQELALYTELTARQNLRFFGRLYGLGGRALESRIDDLLTLVRLESKEKAAVATFSGGMQRRLNIAAALLHKPSLVLMDEPTVGLDPQNRSNILAIVQSVAADGAAVLYSTHYMDEVEQICSRIGIIDHGRLLVEGSLDQLRAEAGGKQVLTLRGTFDAARAQHAFVLRSGESILKSSEDEIVMNLAGAEGRLSSLLEESKSIGDVREVAMSRQSLESLFIQLTGRDLRE